MSPTRRIYDAALPDEAKPHAQVEVETEVEVIEDEAEAEAVEAAEVVSEPAPKTALEPQSKTKILEIRASLRALGDQRQRTLRRLARTENDLARLVKEAAEQGVPKLAISREAQLARETVYKILRSR
jgi:hypothetical protein